MTDPVNKISTTRETKSKISHREVVRTGHLKHHPDQPTDDSVDISEEARDRASGRKRKTILEYLEDDDG